MMAPCTQPSMKSFFLPYRQEWPRSLRSLGLASLLVKRQMRQGGLILAAGRVGSKNKNKTRKSAAPKTHHEIHSSTATATTSRRRATTHVPRVSPHSPATEDPGFVETGLVQLPHLVKIDECDTHIDRHTDKQTN